MRSVPGDGLVDPLGEVRVFGLPAQLAAELGAVDVGAFAIGADDVGLADSPPPRENPSGFIRWLIKAVFRFM